MIGVRFECIMDCYALFIYITGLYALIIWQLICSKTIQLIKWNKMTSII